MFPKTNSNLQTRNPLFRSLKHSKITQKYNQPRVGNYKKLKTTLKTLLSDRGDQILLKNSKCLKSLQMKREIRPHCYKTNATHLGSNRHQEREISRSVQNDKQARKRGADCTVCTARIDADVAGRTTCGKQLFGHLACDIACFQ